MGWSTANTVFMLAILMGMIRDDWNGMAVGLAGKGSPDFDGYEKYLKNISDSRIPGESLKYHCGSGSMSAFKSHMQERQGVDLLLRR